MSKKSKQKETLTFPAAFKKSSFGTILAIGKIEAERRDLKAYQEHVAAYQAVAPKAVKYARTFFNEFQADINATLSMLNGCMPNYKTPEVKKAIADLKELKEDARVVKYNGEKACISLQKLKAKDIAQMFQQNAKVGIDNPAPAFVERLNNIKRGYLPYGASFG